MTDIFNSLTDEEVRQIASLVETLDRSTFDFLQLDVGDMKVTIGKGNAPPAVNAEPSAPAAPPAPPHSSANPSATAPTHEPPPAAEKEAPAPDGTVEITAPMVGRFYAQPDPGSPPFVSVGDEVTADTTIGLIEVMKVFTAVPAGVAGMITEILVQDAEFIEYGHVLMRVRPTGAG